MHHAICMVHGKPGDGQMVLTLVGNLWRHRGMGKIEAGDEREKAWHGPAGTRRCPGLTPPVLG